MSDFKIEEQTEHNLKRCSKCNLCEECLKDFIKKNDQCISIYHNKYHELISFNESMILAQGCRLTRDNKDLARLNVSRQLYPEFNQLYQANHSVAVKKCKCLHTDVIDVNDLTEKSCKCFIDETLLFKKISIKSE